MRLSVVIPVYNVEKWLDSCLNSIENQYEKPDEVIIVNDGSTDFSLNICKKYCKKNREWILINQINQGVSVARNVGIDRATGDFIIFLDSDDMLKRNAIQDLKKKAAQQYYDAIYYDGTSFSDEKTMEIKDDPYNRKMSFIPEGISGLDFFNMIYPYYYLPVVYLCAFRKEVLAEKKIKFPVGIIYEDNYFSFLYISNANCITYIPDTFYCRRYRQGSITSGEMTQKKICDLFDCFFYIMEYIIQNVERYTEYEKKIILYLGSSHEYVVSLVQNIDYNYSLQEKMDRNIYLLEKLCDSFSINIFSCDIDILFLLTRINSKREYVSNDFHKMRTILIKKMIDVVSPIKLCDQTKSIVIYGIGKSTDGLLAFYEKYISSIKANVTFVTTDGGGIYRGQEVKQISKGLCQKTEGIVIASCKYRREMLNDLKVINCKIPLYDLYKNIQINIFGNLNFLL